MKAILVKVDNKENSIERYVELRADRGSLYADLYRVDDSVIHGKTKEGSTFLGNVHVAGFTLIKVINEILEAEAERMQDKITESAEVHDIYENAKNALVDCENAIMGLEGVISDLGDL